MIRFVLLSTQRSGTTFLEHWLNSHPQVRCHSELFALNYPHQDGFAPYCNKTWLSRQFLRFYKNNPQSRIAKTLLARQIAQFMEGTYSNSAWPGPRQRLAIKKLAHQVKNIPKEKAAGFRLMYDHAESIPSIYQTLLKEKIHILHLIRKNKLKIILSSMIAGIRNRSRSSVELSAIQVMVDTKSLLGALEKLCAEEKKWREAFSNHNPYLEITYEDFFKNHPETAAKIEGFFKVTPGRWIWPNLTKLNPDSVKNIAINYDEVVAVLQGTPFQEYLD
jgi:hypothetical protein